MYILETTYIDEDGNEKVSRMEITREHAADAIENNHTKKEIAAKAQQLFLNGITTVSYGEHTNVIKSKKYDEGRKVQELSDRIERERVDRVGKLYLQYIRTGIPNEYK